MWSSVCNNTIQVWSLVCNNTIQVWSLVCNNTIHVWRSVSNDAMQVWSLVCNNTIQVWSSVCNNTIQVWSSVSNNTIEVWSLVCNNTIQVWSSVCNDTIQVNFNWKSDNFKLCHAVYHQRNFTSKTLVPTFTISSELIPCFHLLLDTSLLAKTISKEAQFPLSHSRGRFSANFQTHEAKFSLMIREISLILY